MVDLNNCDCIEVESNEKMEQIVQWYLSNKEWLDDIEFRSPIPTAVIDFKEELILLSYEPEGLCLRMYLCMKGIYVCNFSYNPQSKETSKPIFSPGMSGDMH